MSNKIKLGLAGAAGYWANILKKTIDKLSNCEIVSTFDLKPSPFNYHHTYSIDRFLECDFDAVIVATPPSAHFDVTRRALETNRHVFVEKPISLNSNHAYTISQLAKEKGLVAMCDSTFIFSPEIRAIKDTLALHRFGTPKLVRSYRTNYGPFSKDGTNVVFDLAVHDLSIFNELFGSPWIVNGTGFSLTNPEVIEDAHISISNYKIKYNLHVSWLTKDKNRKFEILTDRGFIHTHFDGKVYFDSFDGEQQTITVENISPLELELTHFVEAIKNKEMRYKSDATDAYLNVAYLEKIVESIKAGGKEIRL